MQVVTQTLLQLGLDKKGEINEEQLILLGLEISDLENFAALSLGKELSDARAELFVLLRDIKAKTSRKTIIANYKALQKFRKADIHKEPTPDTQKVPQETQMPSNNVDVTIYCDGGCTPNPGKAGSGVAVYRGDTMSELWYGLYEPMGTNNTAELGALHESLLIAKREVNAGNVVSIKCDSMYSIDCISKWAINWEKKNWTKKGGEIKNLDIIKKAYYLYNEIKHEVKLSHIKAHAGFEGNELADRMTMFAIDKKSTAFVKYNEVVDVNALLKMRAG